MLRWINRSFYAWKCIEQIQCNSKNFQSILTYKIQNTNKKIFDQNAKRISNTRRNYQGAEKLQEKRESISMEAYLKSSIKNIYLNEKGNILGLHFGENEDLEYPIVWLRDNCQCKECFDAISNSRIHAPLTFSNDITPKKIVFKNDSVSIIWKDGHESDFRKEWLCYHSFHPYHQMERLNKRHLQRVPWNAQEFQKNLQNICFNYDDVINNDRILLKWMETLATFGVAKLSDAPLERGHLQQLAKRVSFIRKTHYGEEYYIKGDDHANNVAYKKGALQMHTDMPYYQYMPGVVLLHFVIQSPNGGENILTDTANVVEQLPRKMYEVLAKTLVDWVDIGYEDNNKFYSIFRAPVLCEDASGNLERVNWSQPQRDSIFNVSSQKALEWYEACEEFARILHDSKNAAVIKNVEGDILTFDNRRILHGRTDYTDGRRFLCGAFLDWDEIYSKIRVLRRDLK